MKKTIMKKKTLFDHIKQITNIQNPNYWEEISDEDKKSWSNYMINRFLSMKSEWTDLVNEIQKYPLESKELYKVYTSILPKKKQWLRYIKGDKKIPSISAASIIAKVSRDKFITTLSKKNKGYDWDKNFGYGTTQHLKALKKLGITKHHRKTFSPISKIN